MDPHVKHSLHPSSSAGRFPGQFTKASQKIQAGSTKQCVLISIEDNYFWPPGMNPGIGKDLGTCKVSVWFSLAKSNGKKSINLNHLKIDLSSFQKQVEAIFFNEHALWF